MREMGPPILSVILLLFFVFIVGVSICLILINTQLENVGSGPKPDQLACNELIMIEAKNICALHKNNIAKKQPFQ